MWIDREGHEEPLELMGPNEWDWARVSPEGGRIAVAILVLVLYGGFLCGVVPLQAGISWQAHLFGFIGGVLAAYALSNGRLQATP